MNHDVIRFVSFRLVSRHEYRPYFRSSKTIERWKSQGIINGFSSILLCWNSRTIGAPYDRCRSKNRLLRSYTPSEMLNPRHSLQGDADPNVTLTERLTTHGSRLTREAGFLISYPPRGFQIFSVISSSLGFAPPVLQS